MLSMKTIGVLAMAGLSLAACKATEEALQEQGAVLISKAELETLLTGKTEKWSSGNGSSYFSQDGGYLAKFKGDPAEGTWKVTDDSVLCLTVEKWWGDNETCRWTYYKIDTGYTVLDSKKGTKVNKPVEDFTLGNSV